MTLTLIISDIGRKLPILGVECADGGSQLGHLSSQALYVGDGVLVLFLWHNDFIQTLYYIF